MRTTLLFALAFTAGTCAQTLSAARFEPGTPPPLARVLVKVYDSDGWKTLEDLTFFRDGRYRRVTYDLKTKQATAPKAATLAAEHLKALKDKVANSGQFKDV